MRGLFVTHRAEGTKLVDVTSRVRGLPGSGKGFCRKKGRARGARGGYIPTITHSAQTAELPIAPPTKPPGKELSPTWPGVGEGGAMPVRGR